jgi:hypothetical protein
MGRRDHAQRWRHRWQRPGQLVDLLSLRGAAGRHAYRPTFSFHTRINAVKINVFATAAVAIIFGGFVGCGSTQPAVKGIGKVEGKVLSPSGTPIAGGTLVLRPKGGIRRAVTAEISTNGSFVIEGATGNDSVLPGEYEVYIALDDSPQNQKLSRKIPLKYQRLSDEDSDLSVTLSDNGNELLVKLNRG